ncbi:MAG: Fur family transcriptional regulator [Desulfobacterales bacterium]|nr:Fur family transcriptional regulator [Desulfobacterales bacterium]
MSLRMTNQREIILQELQKSGKHLAADELYERVKKIMPRISLATVYRNLETLSETGVIAKLEISGRQKRFDYDASEHDHIYCVQCQKVDNIELDREVISYSSTISAQGYKITGYRLELVGICPVCRKNNQKRGEKVMPSGSDDTPVEVTEEQKKILQAMAASKDPCGSKDIASATGLEAKIISSRITAMKKKGLVESPVHCKYTVTEEGRAAIG